MRKLMSTNYTAGAFNAATLFLRLFAGILLMNHGYGKLTNFSGTASHMPHFLGMSGNVTAALVIFAEFFCSLFVILGLFTRMASLVIIINMGYALAVVHNWKVFEAGETAALYLGAFIVLLILGPGKVSVDGMTGK